MAKRPQEFYRPIGHRSLQIEGDCCEILEDFHGRNSLRPLRLKRPEERFTLLVFGPYYTLVFKLVEIDQRIGGIEAEDRANVV